MRLRDMPRERGLWILSAVVAALFWRPLTFQTFFFRDLYLLFYSKRAFVGDAIRSGTLPLWDPFTNGGQPYLASPANFAFHPSNILYAILPTLVAFNWVLVLHVLFCGAAAYWLARTTNLPQSAAFVTGAVFALCGYTLSAVNLMPLILALPWLPLTVGLAHQALRDGRSIVPATIAATVPLYCGAAELTAILFLTLIIWVGATRYERTTVGWKAAAATVVIVFAIALSAMQTIPASGVIAQSSRRARRSYEGFTAWSVSPQRLAELAVPRFFGPTGTLDDRDYWGRGLESNGFPYMLSIYFGVPALLLVVAGASGGCRAELPRRSLAALAGIAIVLSLGRWLPGFRFIYDFVPLVTRFRYPIKALIAAALPLSLLAGCGLTSIAESRRRVAFTIAALAAIVGIALVVSEDFTAAFASLFSFVNPSRTQLGGSFAHVAIAAAAFALAVSLPRHREVAMAAVVVLDLAVAGASVNVYAPRSLFDTPPIAGTVRGAIRDGRFHAAERQVLLSSPSNDLRWLARWQMSSLAGYTAANFGIPVIFHADYDGLAPRRIAALSAIVDRLPWRRRLPLLEIAGVGCFATADVLPAPAVTEIARIEAPRQPIRFYALPAGAPARFVSAVDLVRDEAGAAMRLVNAADPSRVTLLRAPLRAGGCGTAPVAITSRTLNSTSYGVDAPCSGYVVFAESDYDGWRASVDGNPSEILNADYAFTAVAVRAGKHSIERRFTQPGLVAGAVTSSCALLLLVPLAAYLRRRTTVGSTDPG